MKRIKKMLSVFLVVLTVLSSLCIGASAADNSKKMKIGLNVFANDIYSGHKGYDLCTDNGKNVDFVVCHFSPRNLTINKEVKVLNKVAEKFAKSDTDFILNFEFQNSSLEELSHGGFNWIDDSNGCHKLKLPKTFLNSLVKCDNCIGIMYDEFEHMIVHRNPTIQLNTTLKKNLPVFPIIDTKDVYVQGENLTAQLTDYANTLSKNHRINVYGENVLPVLYHKFAESGIVPNFKSQKETYTNIQYAIAAGAALEYGMPLSNCIDNWYFNKNPGHSADEMASNFMFAYYAGVNTVYTESVVVLTENDDGKVLTEHGKKFIEVCKNLKGKKRSYDISDYRPEIGIIRYDDTFYGQWLPVVFQGTLLGSNRLLPSYKSKEYLKVFNLLTHGETSKTNISWDSLTPSSLKKHRSYVSLNSTAVFDHQVEKDKLDSLKLCFLCGEYISDKTLSAVRDCVKKNGLTVVTTKRFAPEDISDKSKGAVDEIEDGNGKWIVINSYSNPLLKKYIEPFTGNKGEMRLTFKNKEIVLKISNDGNSFTVKK